MGSRTLDRSGRDHRVQVFDSFGVDVYRGAAFVRVGAGCSFPPGSVGADRAAVCSMSAASRRRLLYLAARLRVTKVRRSLFITLTYPGVFPDPVVAKRDLATWWKRAERKWPSASCIWRVEPQRRGAPHFHLLVFGVGFLDKQWLSESWYSVVGSDDPRHLRAGTQVARPDNVNSLISYIGKELCGEKPGHFIEQSSGEIVPSGRCWGVLGRKYLPLVQAERWHVPVIVRDRVLSSVGVMLGFEALNDYPLSRSVFLANDDVDAIADRLLCAGAVLEPVVS